MQRDSKRQQQPIAPVPQPRLQRRTETPDNTAKQAARADQQAARQANYTSFIQRFATTPEASLATDILSTQAPLTDHHSAARALPGAGRVRLQRLLQSQHVARSLSLGREALNPVQRASDQTVEDLTGLPLQRAAAPTANLETRLQRHRDAKASLQPAVLEPSLAPRSTQLEVQRTPLEGRSPRLSVQRADDGQNQLGHSSPNLGRNVQRSPAHSDAVNEHISSAQTARVQRQRAVTARAGEMKAQMLSTQVQRLRAPDAPNLEPSGKAYTLTGQAERINTELPIMRAKHNHDPAYLDGDTKPVTDFSRHVGLSLGRQYHVQRTKSGARPRDLSAVISRVHDAHDRANLLTSTLMTFNPNDREAASVQRLVAERENELELQRQTLETDLEPVTQRLAEREAEHPENLSAMIARAGGGEELPEKVKRQLQPQFNFSLDIVRIHRDGYADMLAKTVNAIAFTTGTSIFFRSGKFDPSSSSGRGLLVHELTHVGQQLAGLVGKGIDEGQEDSPHEGAAAKAGAIEEAKGALPEPAARDAVESWGVSNGMGAQQVAGGTSVLQRTPDKPRGKKSKRTSGSSKIIKKESVSSYLEVKYTFNIDPARIFTAKGFKDIKLYHLTTADMEGMQRAYQEKYENSLRFITFPDQKDGKSKHYVFLKNAQRNIFKVDADSKPRNILPEKVSGSENKVGTEVENKTKSGMPGDGTSVQLPRGSRNLRQEIISLMRRKALDLLEKSEVEVDKLLEDVNDESFESKVLKPEVRQKFAKAAKEVVRINGAIERIENNLAKTSNTYKNNIGRIINLRDPKVINSSMKDNSSTNVESLTTEKMRERELIAKELEEDNFLIANKVIKPSQEALDLLRKVKVSASSIHSLLYSASSDDLEFYKRNPLYNTDVDNTLGRMRTRLKEIQTNIITTRENIADDSFLWSVDGLFESSVKDVNFSDSDRKEIRDIRSSEQVVKNLKSFAWTFLELGFTAGAIVFGGPLGFAFAVLSFTSSTYDAVDDVQKFYRDKAAANTDPNGEKSLIPKTPDEIQLQGILAFLSVVGTAADGLDVLDAAKFLGEIKTAVKEKDIPEYLTSQVKKESSEISPSSVGKNPAGEGMEKSGSGVPAPTKEIGVEKTDSTISVSEMKTQNPSTPDSGPPTTPKNLKTPAKSIPPKPKSITGYRESLHEELGSNWKSWVKSRVAKARAAAKDKNIRIPRNISREELACLQDYTTSSYQRINNALRFEKEIPISAKDKLIIALAESARKKFPTFEGTVYRGVSSGDWLDQYTVGATVSDEAFLSTTSMSGRQSLGDTLITIKNSKGGHDISSISRGSGVNEEGEILFKPGAKFKVISNVELGKDIKKAPYPHPQSQDVLVTREIVLEPVPERSLKKPDKKPKKSKENLKDLEKNFVGKEAGEANLPPGYRYAEIGNAKYAYLETSDTTKVPLLKADRKGNWYVPKSSSYRVADTKRYTTNYGKKTLETRSQIHHLIADNLWRRTPILQEILRRGIADMDLKPNLIELGEKMEDIARAKAINPHFPEIPHLAGHPIYDQIANKILEDFVDAAMIKNEKIDVLKFTNQELLDTLKLAQDEILRLLRDEPDRFPRKLDGSLAQLESPDTTNASMTGEV